MSKKAHDTSQAIRNAWMSDSDLEARAGSLATINAIADTVYRYLDFKTLVEHAADVVLEYIPVNSVVIFTLDDSGQWLDAVASRGFDEETLNIGSRLPVHGSATGITVTQKDVVTDYEMVQNDQMEPHVKQALLERGLTGFISVPLLFHERAVGAVNLIFQKTHTLTSLERDTLLAVGKTIGLAIVNAQYVNRIEAEIRERRRVEEELRRYQEHLEELVAGRTTELKDANEQLRTLVAELQAAERALRESNVRLQESQQRTEQASQAKTTFLSNMSHELRTPLNVIIGYTSSMLAMSPIYDEVPLPEIYAKDIQLVLNNGQYLLGMINDILDLSKIEAGKFELYCSEVSLAAVFKGVIATSIGLIKDKPVQIRSRLPDELPLVWADEVRVRQIILNLMSNAIKFTKAGSVTLQAQVEADFVRISVIDTGIGIPAKALPYIFDRFQQAEHDTSKHYGGTGLGLDISKQLTHMHGGQMTVSSVVGTGSTFSITLPIAENQAIPVTEEPKVTRSSIKVFKPQITNDLPEPATILIVASEIGIRNLMQRTLEGVGYIVLDADDSAQALKIAQDLSPDLIILGRLDNWHLVDELKMQSETASIPIIICTGDNQPIEVSGATLLSNNPMEPEQFLSVVSKTLSLSSTPHPESGNQP
ncbi:MAG: ATP-binding protein [Aggregatilineales bacterium]